MFFVLSITNNVYVKRFWLYFMAYKLANYATALNESGKVTTYCATE